MIKRSLPPILLLVSLAVAGLACSLADRAPAELTQIDEGTATIPTPAESSTTPVTGEIQSEIANSPSPDEATAKTEPLPSTTPTVTPVPTVEPAANNIAVPGQQDSFERLAAGQPPERDDYELARLYGGWNGRLSPPSPVTEPSAIGTVQQFRILNHDDTTYSMTPFELLAVSEHAYFWFSEGLAGLSQAAMEKTGRTFDDIYEQSTAIFGPEDRPGVDGDPRLHIVNAAPALLCADPSACGLAGYFSSDDVLPKAVDPDSNAREMFVMNSSFFGSDFYLNVLAHELRHMIEDNYDRGDDEWEGEGSAMLAEDLLGYADKVIGRANLFLSQPDQQLNAWTDGDTIPYYGQGYLFNRFIYDRLGPELYRQFASSPATGLGAIDEIATANDLPLTGHQLWLDWLVAMALIGAENVQDTYRLGIQGLDAPAMTETGRYPTTFDETVQQYAVDFYRLSGAEELTIDFAGTESVTLLSVQPFSGEAMWLTDRANNSHARLTRAIDLTNVSEATLEYRVLHDIEAGYDFAYVFLSEDGGESWQPLVAEHMQGPEEDPSDSALAERFYSGRGDGWRQERIDLTPYAGREVLIRFAYVTDMVLTYGGLALDDIAVPEIGFHDDAESGVEGWTAEGFERVTRSILQQWHLLLITFPDGQPKVALLPLASDQTAVHSFSLGEGDSEAILIVAAWAPMTLQPAGYHLSIQQP